MSKLLLLYDSQVLAEYELRPGRNRLGRAEDNDLVVEHETVGAHHCELHLSPDGVRVVDLGSTYGTWIAGEQVEVEAILGAGQSLQLGEVQFVLQGAPARRVGTPTLRVVSLLAEEDAEAPRSFGEGVRTAFVYPFRRSGGALLLAGAAALWLTDVAAAIAGQAVLFGLLALLILTIGVTGYLFGFIKDVVRTSAQGESSLPGWPDMTSPADFVGAFLQFLALVLVSFGPMLVWSMWQGGDNAGVMLALGGLGAFYFPMALVGISMADSIGGLNPLVLLPSIARILGHYLVAFVLVAVIAAVKLGGDWLAAMLPIPFVTRFSVEFATLYLLVVTARVLGVMYYVNREALGWFK